MKILQFLFLLSFLAVVSISCKPSQALSDAERAGFEITMSLQDRLSRKSGVTVTGTGANAVVRIRGGVSTFSGSAEPLFILNGQPLNAYVDLYANVDPRRIKNINVLKGPDAAAYGARGGTGVIEVMTF